MPKDRSYGLRDMEVSQEPEHSRSLLAQGAADEDGSAPASHPPLFPQSSLSQTALKGLPRAPRTINRVRFDVEATDGDKDALNGHTRTPSREAGDWPEAENGFFKNSPESRRSSVEQRAPLLANSEAPSVMVVEDLDFNAEGLLENARPKSGIM